MSDDTASSDEEEEQYETDDYWWLLGVFFCVIGASVSNLGLNLQKYAQRKMLNREPSKRVPYYKYPLWWFGFGLVAIGNLGPFAALSFAPQSIVSPMHSFTLVANLFFAKVFLKESLQKTDILGVVFIIAGATVSVVAGSHYNPDTDLSQLQSNYAKLGFQIYIFIVFGIAIIEWYVLSKIIRPLRNKLQDCMDRSKYFYENNEKTMIGNDSNGSNGSNGKNGNDMKNEKKDNGEKNENSKSGDSSSNVLLNDNSDEKEEELIEIEKEFEVAKKEYSKWVKIHPFLCCSLSGILGAQSVLMTKSVAELLKVTWQGNNQFDYFLTYVFIFGMGFFIACQINYINEGLKYFDSLYCVPVFQCFFIVFSTFGGFIFFQEYLDFEAGNWIFFPIGILLTVFGVYIESLRSMTGNVHMINSSNNRGKSIDAIDGIDDTTFLSKNEKEKEKEKEKETEKEGAKIESIKNENERKESNEIMSQMSDENESKTIIVPLSKIDKKHEPKDDINNEDELPSELPSMTPRSRAHLGEFIKFAKSATKQASQWFELPHVDKNESLFMGIFPTPGNDFEQRLVLAKKINGNDISPIKKSSETNSTIIISPKHENEFNYSNDHMGDHMGDHIVAIVKSNGDDTGGIAGAAGMSSDGAIIMKSESSDKDVNCYHDNENIYRRQSLTKQEEIELLKQGADIYSVTTVYPPFSHEVAMLGEAFTPVINNVVRRPLNTIIRTLKFIPSNNNINSNVNTMTIIHKNKSSNTINQSNNSNHINHINHEKNEKNEKNINDKNGNDDAIENIYQNDYNHDTSGKDNNDNNQIDSQKKENSSIK